MTWAGRILTIGLVLALAACAPSKFKRYSGPEVTQVVVNKGARQMLLLHGNTVLKAYRIGLGNEPIGHKQFEGDGKTPEGRYVLDYRKADSAFYKALHVSYPNAQDLAAARARGVNPGGLIMIHGQKNGLGWLAFLSQRFDWTQGCIALRNEHMDILWRLTPLGTPVDIRP